MKESRCRWGEAPWKRVGGEQRRELLLRSSTGSFAFDAELPSPPLPPFPPSFIEHMWKPGGEIPSSLGTDLNNIFHLFLHFNIKKFWSIWWCFFLLIFSFSELWKWAGWSLRSRGTDPAEAKESPWSPFARVNVRHSINRNKDFSRANKQKLLLYC